MSTKFLIVGASAGTGIKLVELLLSQSYQVGIVVRNLSKTKDVFKNSFDSLSKVVQFEFGLSTDTSELEKAISWSDILISNLGPVKDNAQVSDYEAICELISLFEKNKANSTKKFVMISAMLVTRPWHPFTFLLNWYIPYVMGWKALAENELRKSKLDYLIVRPPQLTDEKTKGKLNPVLIDQGDKMSGRKISRENLAHNIINLVQNKDLTKRVTVDIVEVSQPREYDIKSLKEDDEKSIITGDHFTATRNITVFIYTLLFVLFCYLITIFK